MIDGVNILLVMVTNQYTLIIYINPQYYFKTLHFLYFLRCADNSLQMDIRVIRAIRVL